MSWIVGAKSNSPLQNGTGPGFTRYTNKEFEMLERQHNIMVFVGNGFDIQALHDYSRPVDSRYEPFYHYLKMRNFNQNNLIFSQMNNELKRSYKYNTNSNWSDIEAALATVIKNNPSNASKIFVDLQEIQTEFAQFLQLVVPNSLLKRIGADASSKE